MDADMERLRRAFFPPDSQRQHQVFQGTVKDVNEQEFTCTVREADAVDYFDVRLRAVIDENLTGVALVPKVGSYVMVGRIANSNELYIAKPSEISKIVYSAGENKKINFSAGFELDESGKEISDKPTLNVKWGEKISVSIDEETMRLTNDQSTIEMTANGIFLNGRETEQNKMNGLIWIDKLTEKLNDLVKAFNNHTHTIPPESIKTSGSPSSQTNVDPVSIPVTNSPASTFKTNEYENTRVLQNKY